MGRATQMKWDIPQEEWFCPGHAACPGCGAAQALRFVLKALGKRTMIIIVASCSTPIVGVFPYSAVKIPLMHIAFEAGGATGAGVRAALDVKGIQDVNVVVWAGDGGTFDIGLQSLSGAAERNDDLIYICYDNEAYMNTGIQRSSATPWGSWTTTTPVNSMKDQPKKDIMKIIASHNIPYAATATTGFPEDLIAKIKKAMGIKGTRFIHLLAPCPTGWRFPSELAVKISRLAVETKIFPLYEVTSGERYAISRMPKGIPIKEYVRLQGRFNHLSDKEIAMIQKNIDESWEKLLEKNKTH
jgi:pyruvate/2-oxoacid:ferredoxin oxidoreductase beta subunit